jgi:toxin ParE1/3/4
VIAAHFFHPRASDDIDTQFEYYRRESGIDLAIRFLDAVEEAIAFLYRYPEAGSPRDGGNPGLRGLRSWPIPGFEDLRLYYLRPEREHLLIVRVLHGRRDVARLLRDED